MVELEESNILACQFQTGKPLNESEDAVRKAAQDSVEETDGKPISIAVKWRTVVHRFRFPLMVKRFTYSDAVNWMRYGGPGRGFLIAAVSLTPRVPSLFLVPSLSHLRVLLFFMNRMSSILSILIY